MLSRTGFTLIELLVVIAVVTLIAAILFPVFASAREKARQSACESNLNQLGLAFQLYEADNDGNLPAPVTANTGASFSTTPATWVSGLVVDASTGVPCASNICAPGVKEKWEDIAGVYPYLRQRGSSGSGDGSVYGCPDSLANHFGYVNSQTPPGANYAMNWALQMKCNTAGFIGAAGAVFSKDVDCASGPATVTMSCPYIAGKYAPFNPDALDRPAQTILLYEAVQENNSLATTEANQEFDASTTRYGSAYAIPNGFSPGAVEAGRDKSGITNPYATYSTDLNPWMSVQDWHNGMSNFLFLDGHVKAMLPSQTWTDYARRLVEAGAKNAYPSAVVYYDRVKHAGTGSTDLWYPFGNGVVYLDGNVYDSPNQSNPSGQSL